MNQDTGEQEHVVPNNKDHKLVLPGLLSPGFHLGLPDDRYWWEVRRWDERAIRVFIPLPFSLSSHSYALYK